MVRLFQFWFHLPADRRRALRQQAVQVRPRQIFTNGTSPHVQLSQRTFIR